MVYDKSKKIQNLINQFFIIIICFRCEEEDKTIETHQDPLLDPASEPKVEGLAANKAKAGVFQMLDRLEEVTDDLLNR
jgi:hypothetical protein